MNTRWLGIIFIVGTVAVILDGMRTWAAGLEPQTGSISELAYLIWGISGIGAIMGLNRLNAFGSGSVARALGFLPLFGFVAMALLSGLALVGFINEADSLYGVLAAIAWLALLAGFVLVGILTIAARTWTGWRRFAPLLTVIIPLVVIGIGEAPGIPDLFLGLSYAGFLLLGYAIATAEPASVLPQSATA